jgi:hypothetical protein
MAVRHEGLSEGMEEQRVVVHDQKAEAWAGS